MLIKNGNQFELYPHKVKYIQHGEEKEDWALPSKEWWENFAQEWAHTDIVEFEEITLTQEQLNRLEEVNQLDISEGHLDIVVNYVLNGIFPDNQNHPLETLEIKQLLADLIELQLMGGAQND